MQLLPNVRGQAQTHIRNARAYRPALQRDWTEPGQHPRAVLWIGMNPARADAVSDDRTCRREQKLSARLGFSCYLKGNILDLMAPDPAQLPDDPDLARSAENLPALRRMVARAEWIILAHGKLAPRFRAMVTETHTVLRAGNRPIACFQFNGDGSPAHTRRLRNAAVTLPLVDLRDQLR